MKLHAIRRHRVGEGRTVVVGGDDFTVNIGLVRDGAPVLGVIYVPVTGALYAGIAGKGASRATVRNSSRRRTSARAHSQSLNSA